MRALQLDYVAPRRRSHWIGAAVLAVALGASGVVVERYRDARNALAGLDASESLLAAGRPYTKALSRARLDDEAKTVAEVTRQLTLPWAKMIAAVEQASMKDVVVLQLQPEAQQRLLRLTAEARNPTVMLEYVQRLEKSQGLEDVHLVRHEMQLEQPGRPVQFSVQATLRDSQ